jgi:hypothetical protein
MHNPDGDPPDDAIVGLLVGLPQDLARAILSATFDYSDRRCDLIRAENTKASFGGAQREGSLSKRLAQSERDLAAMERSRFVWALIATLALLTIFALLVGGHVR